MRLVVLVVCGCGRLGFGERAAPGVDAGVDGTADGMVDSPVTSGCTPAVVPDSFDSSAPCVPWGAVITGNSVTDQIGGELVITPAANVIGQGGCTANAPLTAEGLFVELGAVFPSTTTSSLIGISFYETLPPFSIRLETGVLTATDEMTFRIDVPFDPIAHRWWRMRPVAGQIVYEVAADGMTWLALGTSPRVAPVSTVSKNLFAGVSAPEAAPGSARYAGVDICP